MNVKELRRELKPLKKDCGDYPVYVRIHGELHEVIYATEQEVPLTGDVTQFFVELTTRRV